MSIEKPETPLADSYVRAHRAQYAHVTRVDADGELYGHQTCSCDESGCAGNETRLGHRDEFLVVDNGLLYGRDAVVGEVVDLRSADLDDESRCARAAWLASDEPREWDFTQDDFVERQREMLRPSEVEAALRAWIPGDWDREHTLFLSGHATMVDPATDLADDEEDYIAITMTLEPIPPKCLKGREHIWRSPIQVVGGIKENPGVHGHGGGVIVNEVCAHCGAYKVTDTWATNPSNGTQGHTSVEYNEPNDDSLAWVAEIAQDPHGAGLPEDE